MTEPRFDLQRPDFDLGLSPLSKNSSFLALGEPQILRVSGYFHEGWMRDTIELESSVLPCASRAIIDTPEIPDEVKCHVAHVASEDEGRHLSDAVRQLTRTVKERQLTGALPSGGLLLNFRRATRNLGERERHLFGLGVSSVVEVNQGALKLLAESDLINPYQRYYHQRHWADEVHHQAAFRSLAPVAYAALPPDERQIFVNGIVSASWWIGTFDERFTRAALVCAGVKKSDATDIASELAWQQAPSPDPTGAALLRAIGEPASKLISLRSFATPEPINTGVAPRRRRW